MKTLTKTILAASFCLIGTAPVYAGHGYQGDRLQDRMERQHQRIEQGIRSGELTRKESRRLRKQHRALHHLTDRFLEDGWLSKKERRILRNRLDRASYAIKVMKHNDMTRFRYRNEYWEEPRHFYRDLERNWEETRDFDRDFERNRGEDRDRRERKRSRDRADRS